MSNLKIDRTAVSEYSVISNAFIDQFMRDADGDQVKVYLYLIFAANTAAPVNVSSIASGCGISEKKVLSALSYWEKESLITVFYESGDPVTVKFAPVSQAVSAREKHQITRDRMRQILEENKEAQQLIFIASEFFGRPLTAVESRNLLYFYDRLSFPFALCEYLLEYSIEHGAKDLRYVEATGLGWHSEGIRTLAQAKAKHPAKPVSAEARGEAAAPKSAAKKYRNFAEHDYDFREQERLAKEKMFRKK